MANETLREFFGELIRWVCRYQQLQRNEITSHLNLSLRDLTILEILYEKESIDFANLVKEVDLGVKGITSKSTISQAVDRLRTQFQLVQKEWNQEGDQRQPIIKLTDKGVDLVKRVKEADFKVLTEVLDYLGFSPKEDDLYFTLQEIISRFPILFGTGKAKASRVYDFVSNGSQFLTVDRIVGERLLKRVPTLKDAALSNRAFLQRAFFFAAKQLKIKQFLDIGAGFVNNESPHLLVRRIYPQARVVYVDSDRSVVMSTKELLINDDNANAVYGDLNNVKALLEDPDILKLIHFDSPVAIALGAILHFITDDKVAADIVLTLRKALAPGSCLIVSHGTRPTTIIDEMDKTIIDYQETVVDVKFRSAEEIKELFGDMPLLEESKLVYVPEWGPKLENPFAKTGELLLADKPHRSVLLCGVYGVS